jgi:AraC-like DNA-binding protein
MMLYREYPPHPALRRHVACLWTAQAPALPHVHRVLPDNCIDILFQDGGEAGFAVGMMTGPIRVVSAAPVRTVAARFRAGAAAAFLGVPLHALTGQRAGMDRLWEPGEAERLRDALWGAERSDRSRIELLQRALLRRLRGQPDHGADARAALAQAALALIDGGDVLRIEALAAQLRVSRQQLALAFRQQVGLAPKLYARISRFRRAAAMLRAASDEGVDWARLALDCGYFDQPHLIHDFQEFSGATPERFLLAR